MHTSISKDIAHNILYRVLTRLSGLQFNPFLPNAPFLHSPLKTSENRKGERNDALGTNGLTISSQ